MRLSMPLLFILSIQFIEENELAALCKGDRLKAATAGRETTMTLKWIAGRLAMGYWTTVANLLAAEPKSK